MTRSINERGNIITTPTDMERMVREYFKQLHANKFDDKWTNSLKDTNYQSLLRKN